MMMETGGRSHVFLIPKEELFVYHRRYLCYTVLLSRNANVPPPTSEHYPHIFPLRM